MWKYNVLNRYLTCLKGHCQELFLQFNPFPGNLTNIINYFEFEITKQKKKDITVTPYQPSLMAKLVLRLPFLPGIYGTFLFFLRKADEMDSSLISLYLRTLSLCMGT